MARHSEATGDVVVLAKALAARVAVALRAAQEIERVEEALRSRDVIGQAKGILMQRHGLDADGALARLCSASQHANVKVRDVAVWLVEQTADPTPPSTDRAVLGSTAASRRAMEFVRYASLWLMSPGPGMATTTSTTAGPETGPAGTILHLDREASGLIAASSARSWTWSARASPSPVQESLIQSRSPRSPYERGAPPSRSDCSPQGAVAPGISRPPVAASTPG